MLLAGGAHGHGAKSMGKRGKQRQELGGWQVPWVWSVPPAGLWVWLLMGKGSWLYTQHLLLEENTATAKPPAKLHENKTMNRLEIF